MSTLIPNERIQGWKGLLGGGTMFLLEEGFRTMEDGSLKATGDIIKKWLPG